MDLQSTLSKLIEDLNNQRDWVTEVNNLTLLMDRLKVIGKPLSIRELSQVINKSKSWIGVSLVLAKGLKLYPEIEKFGNRNQAYVFLQRKNKFRRLLES